MSIGNVSQGYGYPGYEFSDTTVNGKEEECQTCKNRKYQDGSNENDVSFKSPGHISPEASYGTVMAHEHMHVANAIAKGSEPGKELVSANVSIKMERCPECGKVYAAGGLTTTVIKTSGEKYNDTPYDNARKLVDGELGAGATIDATIS
ncbi:MAG: hypothetical protein K6A30_06855 [Lachnospiraceae bacterium]|nr:hypothetical protein [Lachnospiraceae bacterium]